MEKKQIKKFSCICGEEFENEESLSLHSQIAQCQENNENANDLTFLDIDINELIKNTQSALEEGLEDPEKIGRAVYKTFKLLEIYKKQVLAEVADYLQNAYDKRQLQELNITITSSGRYSYDKNYKPYFDLTQQLKEIEEQAKANFRALEKGEEIPFKDVPPATYKKNTQSVTFKF